MAKILLVEDDNNLREIYEARLQAEGYTIVSAHDGEEALVVAKAEQPDLIISDVMMPKISGFEMLDILRNTDGTKDVKIIMLTALGQSDDQQRADRLGADRYLVKSQVTLEDIVKVTQDLLSSDPTPATPQPVAVTPEESAEPVSAATASSTETQTPQTLVTEPDTGPALPTSLTPDKIVRPAALAPSLPTLEPTTAPVVTAADTTVGAAKPSPTPEPEPIETGQALLETAPESSPPATAASTDAQPINDEAANVEAQIEDYVSQTLTDPAPSVQPETTPQAPTDSTAVAPSVQPATVTVPPVATSPVPASSSAVPEPVNSVPVHQPPLEPTIPTTVPSSQSSNDDQVMATAVDTLVANANGVANGILPMSNTTPANSPADSAGVSGSPSPVIIASPSHKKVIAPLDSSPKPDLNALLAAEEAKGTVTTPTASNQSLSKRPAITEAAGVSGSTAPVANIPQISPELLAQTSDAASQQPPVAVTPKPAAATPPIAPATDDPNSIAL